MSRKWLVVVLVSVLISSSYVYKNRLDIALSVIGFVNERRLPVGPNQDIAWKAGPDSISRPLEERPPNIILILADDLGWNDVSINGGFAEGTVKTPHIDSIAESGVNFTNAYAASATCAPSRAAILSGRYGTRFGFEYTPTPGGMMALSSLVTPPEHRLRRAVIHEEGESIPYDDMGMPSTEITIAELLQAKGYHTIQIGKWQMGRAPGMMPVDQGFDESLLMASGLYLPEDHPEVINARQEFDPIDQFLWAAMQHSARYTSSEGEDSGDFAPDGYLTDYYTQQTLEIIEANKDRPFFLYLSYFAPHTPLQALKQDYEAVSHISLHRERVYGAMIRSLDRGVGQVLAALRENGLEENTLIVFTSDNGAAGYVGLENLNKPYRGWKSTFFEGGIRVPYFLKWPARIPAGVAVDDPVHHFDIFATAATAASAELPNDRQIDGVDLIQYVGANKKGVPHKALFWQSGSTQAALVDGWKLISSDPPGRNWLFDLRSDPLEQRDLSKDRPDKLNELKEALAKHDSAQTEPKWPRMISVPINVDKELTQKDEIGDDYTYWSN